MCLSYPLCQNPDFRNFRGFNKISEDRLLYVCIWRRDILKQAGRRRRRRDIYVNPFLGTGFGGDLYLPWTKAHAGCAKLKHRKRSSHLSCEDTRNSQCDGWKKVILPNFPNFQYLSKFFNQNLVRTNPVTRASICVEGSQFFSDYGQCMTWTYLRLFILTAMIICSGGGFQVQVSFIQTKTCISPHAVFNQLYFSRAT